MLTSPKIQTLFVPASLFALFLAAIVFRPLMPIDETRYMTVAWEMWLRGDWFAPLTVNFEPYHHKPPLLFWLINSSWSIFGVSRWAGLVPVALVSLSFIYLTKILGKKLFRDLETKFDILPVLVIGSVPFIIYSTLTMFDITLGTLVLLALLALLSYAENRKPVFILALALAIGMGVLTKGPVAWLYVIFPVLLAPLWMSKPQNWLSWYVGCALAFILSTIPVLLWLIPVLKATNPDFAFSLVWEQTAGRITGNMENSHARPLYFYLPLLPLLFLPWFFFPSFWKGAKNLKEAANNSMGLRFITCWIIPVVISFSFISGKQPHYLVPLLPGALILTAYLLQENARKLLTVSAIVVFFALAGQGVASKTVFPKYNLQPLADYIAEHQETDWAFVRKYQGELTFLGRLRHPMADEQQYTLKAWFKDHPDGMAVIRYSRPEEISGLETMMTMPYRGKNIGIFALSSK